MTNQKANLTRIEQAYYSKLSRSQKAEYTKRRNVEGREAAIKYAVRIVTAKLQVTEV